MGVTNGHTSPQFRARVSAYRSQLPTVEPGATPFYVGNLITSRQREVSIERDTQLAFGMVRLRERSTNDKKVVVLQVACI